MLRELMSIFRSNDAIASMGDNFTRMLAQAQELTLAAGRFFFDTPPTPDDRTSISKQDVQLNKLERRIRKQVIAHLTLGKGEQDAPYCLLLQSLVKDVERIGDYCKNIAEVYDIGGGPLPDDDNAGELREIRAAVEDTFLRGAEAFDESDTETAMDLLRRGKEVTRRCDRLVSQVTRSGYDAATTTTLVLGARYYKRIQAHLLNILSGVVMPLHKLDYYDEDSLPPGFDDEDDE